MQLSGSRSLHGNSPKNSIFLVFKDLYVNSKEIILKKKHVYFLEKFRGLKKHIIFSQSQHLANISYKIYQKR